MGNIFDLIPRDRLERYIEFASSGMGLAINFLDSDGTVLVPRRTPTMTRSRADGGQSPTDSLGAELDEIQVRQVVGSAGNGPGKFETADGACIVSAPVFHRDTGLGFLAARKKAGDGRCDRALSMLRLCASHIESLAQAGYEMESLSGEVVRVYEELSLLYGVTARLGAMVHIDDICGVVADEAENLMKPTLIMVQLADEQNRTLKTVFAAGAHTDAAMEFDPPMADGLVGYAFVNRRNVLVCEVDEDKRHTTLPFPARRLLCMPLIAEENVMGVVTVLDKRDGSEFDSREEKLFSAIISVASIAIMNSQHYAEIKKLLEGFIGAAVTAVESRDPSTAGHSQRVARMAVELAGKVDESMLPPFRGIRFTREQLQEISYAGLLHDFGKIGVREALLLKGAKLDRPDLDKIRHRFSYNRERLRRRAQEDKLGVLLSEGIEGYSKAVPDIEAALERELDRMDHYLGLIMTVNDPFVMIDEIRDVNMLKEVSESYFIGHDGEKVHYLTPMELKNLSVTTGSLNPDERREIESHVLHSHNFLRMIPWTKDFRMIADIVLSHHERLDGSGYPKGLSGHEIPIQARILAITDIYDALTAWDRPYKKSVSVKKALAILDSEVEKGRIDKDLVNLFRDAQVYRTAWAFETGEGV